MMMNHYLKVILGGGGLMIGLGLGWPTQAAFLSFDQNVIIAESPEEDVYVLGEAIEIQAPINGDVNAAGGNIRITASVADDVHAAGDSIVLENEVADDVFAAGARIAVTEEAVIGGDLYLAGGTIEMRGRVDGDVYIAGGNIVIGSTAVIAGDLKLAHGQTAPVINEGAVISGEQHLTRVGRGEATGMARVLSWVGGVVAWFILAIVILYLAPKWSSRVLEALKGQSWRSLLIGFLWLMLFIPVTILLMVTMVSVPLALVILFGTLALIIVAYGFGVLAVGHFFYEKVLRQSVALSWQQALVGAALLQLLQLIPGLGWAVSAALVIVLTGILLTLKWQEARS